MIQGGTLVDRMRNVYSAFLPLPTLVPETWRLTNIPPVDEDGPGLDSLFATLPIVAEDLVTRWNLSYNIVDLPDTNEVPSFLSVRKRTDKIMRNAKPSYHPTNSLRAVYSLTSDPPIASYVQNNIGVLWWDALALPYLEDTDPDLGRKLKVSLNGYNSRSVDAITADAPMVSITSVDDTANVTFDISILNYV